MPLKILRILQCLYSGLSGSVRVNEWFTNSFSVTQGLRQGCVLSPALFNIFINDLPPKLKATSKGIRFGDTLVCCLLYADDLVILAESEKDLQVLLCQLEEWCDTWKIVINHTKSAVMHFRPKCSTCSSNLFMMNGLPFHW